MAHEKVDLGMVFCLSWRFDQALGCPGARCFSRGAVPVVYGLGTACSDSSLIARSLTEWLWLKEEECSASASPMRWWGWEWEQRDTEHSSRSARCQEQRTRLIQKQKSHKHVCLSHLSPKFVRSYSRSNEIIKFWNINKCAYKESINTCFCCCL